MLPLLDLMVGLLEGVDLASHHFHLSKLIGDYIATRLVEDQNISARHADRTELQP